MSIYTEQDAKAILDKVIKLSKADECTAQLGGSIDGNVRFARNAVSTSGIVSDAKAALELFVQIAKERKAAGTLKRFGEWAERCAERKRLMHRKTHYTEVPIKPMRVYEEMNAAFGRDTIYVTTIGLSQIAAAQFLHVYGPRQWINCGQAGPLGWTIPAALGVVAADPTRSVVGISGDYDFQFLIEELAVGAQFRLPYVHVLVNNSYLGLIRQAQRSFSMDYCVQLGFENINSDPGDVTAQGYGVDHIKVVEGLGGHGEFVEHPEQIKGAIERASQLTWEAAAIGTFEVLANTATAGHRDGAGTGARS